MKLLIPSFLLVSLMGSLSRGQAPPPVLSVPCQFTSGELTNSGSHPEVVWEETIYMPWASSLQVILDRVRLASNGDTLTLRGVEDGETQVLNRGGIESWNGQSAWFNGHSIVVTLTLTPGSTGSVDIDRVAIMVPGPGLDSLCDTDDRYPDSIPGVCRVIANHFGNDTINTAFLINDRSVVLGGTTLRFCTSHVFEFNVPPSNASGLQHPPVVDQFPLVSGTLQVFGDPNSDEWWSIATLGPNSQGETASSRYAALPLAPVQNGPLPAGVIGYGEDTEATNHHSQQLSSFCCFGIILPGSPFSSPTYPNAILHYADTRNGSDGSPLVDGSGSVIGIHHEQFVCITQPPYGSANAATDILRPNLQAAIAGQCGIVDLSPGNPRVISCSGILGNVQVPNGSSPDWNVLAVASSDDWNVSIGSANSSLFGPGCDFMLNSGHLGAVVQNVPSPARFTRGSSGGTADATAQYTPAATIGLYTVVQSSWNGSDIVKAFQFQVPSSGFFEINVSGDSSLAWHLYQPPGGPGWYGRLGPGSFGLVTYGTVGQGPGIPAFLSNANGGWYCLVVFRDGGPAAVSLPPITLGVCTTAGTFLYNPGNPVVVSTPCGFFHSGPVAGQWNAIGISSLSNWDLAIGPVLSQYPGNYCDFVVANGHNGPISPTNGYLIQRDVLFTAVAELVVASPFTPGAIVSTSLPAGHVLALHEFEVPAQGGTYDITVTGNGALFWDLYLPGSDASWRPRGAPYYGAVGGPAQTSINLGGGRHAIIIIKDGGTSGSALPYTINVCPATAVVGLSATPTTLAAGCQPFTVSPAAGTWNVVGVSSTSDWNLYLGAARSEFSGSFADFADFAIADGRPGPIAPTSGMAVRTSGSATATGQARAALGIPVGTLNSVTLPAGSVFVLCEFTILVGGPFDITVTGDNAGGTYRWDVYTADGTSSWRARGSPIYGTVGDAPHANTTLPAGTHALLLIKDAGPATTPLTTGISICPSAASIAVSPSGTAVANSCQVVSITPSSNLWNLVGVQSNSNWDVLMGTAWSSGSGNACDYVVANGHLGAIVPAAGLVARNSGTGAATARHLIATMATVDAPAGTTAIFNGGVSIKVWEFLVASAGCYQISVAGLPNLTWDLFAPGSGPSWRSRSQRLATGTVTPPAATSMVLGTGWHAVVVSRSGVPSGNTEAITLSVSSVASFNPVPTVTSISPTSLAAGSPSTTINVNGTCFVAPSQVWLGNIPLATGFVSSTQLSATVPASLLTTRAVRCITVFNPAPGGGSSNVGLLSVLGPQITGISPTTIAVQGPASAPTMLTVTGSGFNSGSVIHADGVALATTYSIFGGYLSGTLPSSVLGTRRPGGITLTVANSPGTVSNSVALIVGTVNGNRGTVRRDPLAPVPGQAYAASIEGCAPNQVFSLYADTDNAPPFAPWPSPSSNIVLSVAQGPNVPLSVIPLVEGLGLFGQATGQLLDCQGGFFLPGFVLPNPQVGISITVQGVYYDPTAQYGFNLTWARYPDIL